MIPAIVRFSVRHRGWVLGATLAFTAAAALLAARLELDALPDITTNQVIVLTRAPGLTPEEVERRVTRPIEVALGGVPGMVTQRSISRYGISSVTAVFADDVDPYRARQVVQERLNTLGGALPPGVDPPELGPLTGGLGEIFHFTLSSATRTPAELLELAQNTVAPLLRAVPGVVEVNSWGGQRRTIEVAADPIRLAQRGLTLEDLRRALELAVGSAPGATVPSTADRQTLLRAVALPKDPSELAQAMVSPARTDGRPVRVADVAEVRHGSLPRIGAATSNGRGETVYVMVQMLRGANALEVMDGLHARLAAVRVALPAGVRLDVVYDRSILVESTLRTVFGNLAEGGLLVVTVLFAMLGSARAGLLVASVIPLSMLGATSGMVLFGVAGNLMSLGAIDFGLIVDGAVVVVEHVFHTLRPGERTAGEVGDGEAIGWRARVSAAAQAVARPTFFAVLIIGLVYVPVLTLGGVDGKLFRPMALTVVLALATSLVLSLTFIPAAASVLLRPRDVPARDPWLVRAIHRGYAPLLDWAGRHRRAVAASALALLALGALLYARAGTELTPQLDEGDLVVQTTRPPDVSLDAAIRRASALERAVRTVPEVRQVVSRIGSPAVATDIMGIEQADVFIALAPRRAWRPGVDREALIEAVGAAIDSRAPGAALSFTQPIQMRFNELLGGAVTDVTVSVFGPELGELRRLAEEVAAAVRAQPGAVDVRLLAPPDVALIEVRPRPLDAAQRGFTVGEILDGAQAVRAGLEVGATWDGPVRVPVLLRLGADATAETLARLPLPSAAGGLVPLADVADVRLGPAPGLVGHEDGQRRLLVGFNVRGADLGRTVAGAQEKVDRAVRVPEGYRLVWGGQYEQLREATRRLAIVIPVVIALILAVLLAAFRRLRPALVIFTHVPFACVGGVLALSVRGMPVSLSAAIGFIALSGIAVLNGVVLMSRVLAEEAAGYGPAEAARRAAEARARPVLMTALVAALGFVPMMLARGVGAEVQRPLATVVVGGLVTATLLTLVILPTAYPWFAGRRARRPA